MQSEQALEQTSLTPLMNKLAAFEPNGNLFITIYLNTQSADTGRDNFAVWLKKELAERGKEYAAETDDSIGFKMDTELILEFADKINPQANGVAIFASSGGNFFETAQFAAPVHENLLLISDRPHIMPLARIIAENPAYICAWSDTNAADIYVFGGELAVNVETEVEAQVEEIKNVNMSRQKAGGWSQQRFQRRVENSHQNHAKEVADTLEKLARDEKIDLVIVSGESTGILPLLREEMNKELSDKIVADMNLTKYASEKELHDASLEELRSWQKQQDVESIRRLQDEVGASNLGVIGVSATLAALSNGQVQELYVLTDTEKIEYSERRVEKVLEEYAPGDDNTSHEALPDTTDTRQILDELIVRAVNSAAKIRFIEDTTLLSDVGGVGALLRYKIDTPETVTN